MIKKRRSIRLKGYDYSREGAYFVTICAQNRKCLFGEIVNGKMVLNDAGRMVESVWNEIPKYYPGIDIDVCQIMPDHIHGIVVIVVSGQAPVPALIRGNHEIWGNHRGLPLQCHCQMWFTVSRP